MRDRFIIALCICFAVGLLTLVSAACTAVVYFGVIDNGLLADDFQSTPDDTIVPLGFEIEPNTVSDNLYTYQVGAFAQSDESLTVPTLQVTIPHTNFNPQSLSPADTASLWVGAILDNGYFIQLGIITSNGELNYFWEMWDDHDVYRYGWQEPLKKYNWDSTSHNTFTMRCSNAETGEWEFVVNGQAVGRTYTNSCAMQAQNENAFFELTTPNQNVTNVPNIGPWIITNLAYADNGDSIKLVDAATVSYSFGQVITGAHIDQAAVCPPYGAEPLSDGAGAAFGASLDCTPQNSLLWSAALPYPAD